MNGQPVDKVRVATNIGHLILSAWAMTLALPMRRFAGKDFIGLPGLLGIVLIPLYAGFANAPQIFYLLPVYLFSLVLHRLGQWKLRFQGITQHTHYEGYPWVARHLLFTKDERTCKANGEPFLAIMAGFFLLPVGEAFGFYFIIGGFAMAIVQQVANDRFQRRIDEMHNARIDNANIMKALYQHQNRRRR